MFDVAFWRSVGYGSELSVRKKFFKVVSKMADKEATLLTNTQYQTQQSNSNRYKCKGGIIIIISFAFILIIGGLIYFLVFYDKLKSDSNSNNNNNYDYIVIGSGPSGSIVATRIAQTGYSVLLLEAGNTTQYSLP